MELFGGLKEIKMITKKKYNTFSQEVRDGIYKAQRGLCKACCKPIDDFHHRLPNTKCNQLLFPLFLQSPFNCVGLSRDCHDSEVRFEYRIREEEAEVYEGYLQELRDMGVRLCKVGRGLRKK